MKLVRNLVENPLYYKIAIFSIMAPESILVRNDIVSNIINIFFALWALAFLLNDFFRKKFFLRSPLFPLFLIMFFVFATTNIINFFFSGAQIMPAASQMTMLAILFFVFAVPSIEKSKEGKRRELSIISLVIVISTLPLTVFASAAYLLRFNLFVPFINARFTYDIAGQTYNAHWYYNFFSLFDNPNFVSSYMIVIVVCALLVLLSPLKDLLWLQKTVCFLAIINAVIVFTALQVRGGTLSFIVGTFAISAIVVYKLLDLSTLKSIFIKVISSAIAGIVSGVIMFLVISNLITLLPSVGEQTSEAFENIVHSFRYEPSVPPVVSIGIPVEQPTDYDLMVTTPPLQPFAGTLQERDVNFLDNTGSGRVEIWEMYFRGMDFTSFVLGSGPENRMPFYYRFKQNHPHRYELVSSRFSLARTDVDGNTVIISPHNELLELLLHNGIFILTLFLFLILIVCVMIFVQINLLKIRSKNFWINMVLLFFVASALANGLTLSVIFRFTLFSQFFWYTIGYISSFGYGSKKSERLLCFVSNAFVSKIFPSIKLEYINRD